MVNIKIFAGTCVLVIVILELGITDAIRPRWKKIITRNRQVIHNHDSAVAFNSSNVNYQYATNYTDEIFPMDHFAYNTDHKFRLKYLHNTTFYKPGGPVFFYAGNEGQIEDFANNTGIMWDIAPHFNAAVVFAEHRYYGVSLPYNNFSTTYKHLGYLSSIQALADYSVFLPWVKEKLGIDAEAKVVVFGGSYGGMLATWFRLKYPTSTVGAWAGSAPVLYFNHTGVSVGTFDYTVKQDFIKSGCDSDVLEKALNTIWRLPMHDLNRIFKIKNNSGTCDSSRDKLYNYVQGGLIRMVETDYPYPTNFLYPMQGWPVALACQQFSGLNISSPETDLATALAAAANVFYNGTGQINETDLCGDDNGGLGDDVGILWYWQVCTEIVMPMCTLGPPNDLFNVSCNASNVLPELIEGCVESFYDMGYTSGFINPNAVQQIYGFDFSSATNIIFTNGELDPWSGGGVNENTPGIANAQNRGIYNFFISSGAHHLDLRQPNSCDPPSVVNARYQAVQVISCWLTGTSELGCPVKQHALPVFEGPYNSSANCFALVNQYPWGQHGNGALLTLPSVIVFLVSLLFSL